MNVTLARRLAIPAFALAAGATTTDNPANAHPLVVVVDGTVGHRLQLTTADLAGLPQHTITVSFLAGTELQTHTYTGPLLLDVLNLAQPRFNPKIKNDKL